jgi:superfamily I DNA/RNA helicase
MRPEILLGPPGTGKTHALLEIVEQELARGTAPDRIGFFSFTRRAADEAAERACAKFGLSRQELPWFRTLHSMAFRQLGITRGDVMEGRRLHQFGDYAGIRLTGKWSEDGLMDRFTPGDRALFLDNMARVRRITLRQQYDMEDEEELDWRECDRVSRCLRAYKEAHGLLDFTDMLEEFVRQAPRTRLEVLLVDEFQDTSRLQHDAVQVLARGVRRHVVAGDDDQGIYAWSGADVEAFVDLDGESRTLGQSFRVPPVVQAVAQDVIGRVRHRRKKEWSARAGEGSVERAVEFASADVGGEDVLVLARNGFVLTDMVEPVLRAQGVVYERNGVPSIGGDVLEAITDWERLRAGGSVGRDAARRVYRHMSSGRGFAPGHSALPGLAAGREDIGMGELLREGGLLTTAIWHEALDRLPPGEMSYILAARRRGEKLRAKPRVRLSTIHGSKGGQARHVVVLQDIARRTQAHMEKYPDDEARVWYVAVTRAQERLTVVSQSGPRGCDWF